MVVGTMVLTLHLFERATLKDKRAVVRRVRDRVGNKFNVAVAEVDSLGDTGTATLGLACVSNDPAHAHVQLMRVLRFVEKLAIDAEIADVETSVVHV
jgi:uncharacterized protein YlxP (DUF503 family)